MLRACEIRNLQCRQGSFEAFQNMERVQRLPASPGYQAGICKTYQGDKKLEDIQGIRFTKDGQTFKASQISREFSFARLNAQLSWKTSESQQASERKVQQRIPDGGHLLKVRDLDCSVQKATPLPKSRYLRKNSCADAGKEKEERIRAVACPFFIQIIYEH